VTSAALASAGLTAAVKAFRDLAAPDGNMMNLEPEFILVPTDLEYTARNIYVSQEIRDTTASTKTFTTNVYQNKFKPIVVPELGSSSFTGYSATSWHMLCSPAILASASMCFLNGQQSPTIESADADFNTLGIQFRGYHDFGAQMTEYRASVEAQA
ncbi:MAG TPA: Mu-like prophage major head subunit gpT family protein, partial [Thermoguttaceae bacterium]|nr:Mu-like prophage major head subunit gpT family protein [Thermoguttaceae bacterium]